MKKVTRANDKEPWYSVKSVFEHPRRARAEGATLYEERVVVLRARSLNDAIARGEEEALRYVGDDETVRYTGFISAFHLSSPRLTDGTEVYSLMRESSLSPDSYLDRFHDDGAERSQIWPVEPPEA